MTAQRLRDAVKVLRDRADGAHFVTHNEWSTDGHQVVSGSGGWCLVATTSEIPEDDRLSSYIATMSPSVGLALADWLEAAALGWERRGVTARVRPDEYAATDLATLILGGAA